MEQLFNQFLREKQYLVNTSPTTNKYYQWVFNRWKSLVGQFPDKQNVKEFVIKLTESGIAPSSINSYISGFNSFLTWLHENDHLPEPLRIKKIKVGQLAPKTFSEDQLKRFPVWA